MVNIEEKMLKNVIEKLNFYLMVNKSNIENQSLTFVQRQALKMEIIKLEKLLQPLEELVQ